MTLAHTHHNGSLSGVSVVCSETLDSPCQFIEPTFAQSVAYVLVCAILMSCHHLEYVLIQRSHRIRSDQIDKRHDVCGRGCRKS
jgi:hypothetical protein